MNRERGALWVDGLLGGEFEQARGSFVEVEVVGDGGKWRHCCLAVAMEVAVRNGLDTVRFGDGGAVLRRYDEVKHGFLDDYDHDVIDGITWISWDDGDLPPEVADWYGLSSNPELDGETAIQRNDEIKNDFEQIAAAVKIEMEREDAP